MMPNAELLTYRINAWLLANRNCGESVFTSAELEAMHIMEEALALIPAQSDSIKTHREGRLAALEKLANMKSNCLFFCAKDR